MLRALLLAGDDDARRQVRQAHRRVRLVHVLAAGAAGAVGVDAQVLVLDLDVDVVVDLRDGLDGRERRLAALVGVERGDAHKAVDAALGLEHSEGVWAFDLEVDVLVAGLLALLRVVFLDLPALALGVALVHPVEHRDPVAGLGAALAGVELHEHVAGVELAAEERLEAELREEVVGLRAFGERVLEGGLPRLALLHLGELEHHAGVLDRLLERRERHDVCALGVRRGDDVAGLGLVVPEIASRLLGLQSGKPLAAVADLDVVGHLADLRLQPVDALPDFLRLDQLRFLLFRHNLRIIPYSPQRMARCPPPRNMVYFAQFCP